MILRSVIVRKAFIQNLFEMSDKFSSMNKVRAVSNTWISKITPENNQKPKFIVESQCYEISKRYFYSNCIKSKLRKDDDLQPELKEVPLEEGDFSLSVTHYDRKIQDKDIGRKFTVGESVITALNNVYGIERRSALYMMQSKKFLLVADSNILKTIVFLANCKISPEQLQRNPWLLLYDPEILQRKMDIIVGSNLFKCIEDGLGFCYFTEKRIYKYQAFLSHEAIKFPHHQNRLYCMADILEVPVAQLTERIVKPHWVMQMNFNQITDIIDLLKSYNVSNEDILRDVWIFLRNRNKIEERLRIVTEAGCTRPRLWMCRCLDSAFERTVKLYEDEKLILSTGRMTVIEYLAEKLETTPERIKLIGIRNPKLLLVKVSKLQSVIEMLLSEGITREAIIGAPRVLQHSTEKLRRRIHRLKALGYPPTSCTMLVQANTYFDYFCYNIKEHGANEGHLHSLGIHDISPRKKMIG